MVIKIMGTIWIWSEIKTSDYELTVLHILMQNCNFAAIQKKASESYIYSDKAAGANVCICHFVNNE